MECSSRGDPVHGNIIIVLWHAPKQDQATSYVNKLIYHHTSACNSWTAIDCDQRNSRRETTRASWIDFQYTQTFIILLGTYLTI